MMRLTDIRACAFQVVPATTAKRVTFLLFEGVRFKSFVDIGECSSDPCQNGGTCIDEINAFTCNCMGGYTGDVCETSKYLVKYRFSAYRDLTWFLSDIDECAFFPCKNNGTCIDGIDYFTCQCMAGYTGSQCETSEGVSFMAC